MTPGDPSIGLLDGFGDGISGVVSTYLFGSRAEGRAHRESDVDLGVVLDRVSYPTSAERFDARLALTALAQTRVGVPRIDLIVLNDAPPQLSRRVMTEGRRLFVADPGAERAFLRDCMLRAADIEPFIQRTRRTKNEAIRR